jgi:hypothetical protein
MLASAALPNISAICCRVCTEAFLLGVLAQPESVMGTIKLILTLGLLAMGVWVSAELIPPVFSNYEFQDTLDTEARLGTYSTKGDEVIRDAVFRKAQDLELPLSKDDIKVQRTGAMGSGSVSISTDYTVHVDLPGYPMDLHFHPESKNKGTF